LQEANRVSSRWRSKSISIEDQSAAKISALESSVKTLQDAAAASVEVKKSELAMLRQQLETSFNSQQQALHFKLSNSQHTLRQLESECSASKARIKELEASSAKLRVRKAAEEERLTEEIRKLRLNVKSLQEQLSQANSKSGSLLSSGDAQLRQHHDEKSSLLAENAALREQLQKLMNMRTVLPAQSASQLPPAAAYAPPATQQSYSNEAAYLAQGTPHYSRQDNGASSVATAAADVPCSPWMLASSTAVCAPTVVQQLPTFTPSSAASAVATPLWSHGGSRAGLNLGMSFASQLEASSSGGGRDESSELLKQQYVPYSLIVFAS
jgi:phage host-nuclease inhibitor protein Gam